VVIFMFWPLYPQERTLVPIELGGWLGHRAGHDVFGEERFPAPTGICTPDHPACSLVTIPTMLPRSLRQSGWV
jgi:hypothetical protein